MIPNLLTAYRLKSPLTTFPLSNGSNNRVIGIRSGDLAQGYDEFVLKSITAPHHLAALQHEQRLLHWLAMQSLPFNVPAPLPTRSGELILHDEADYHILMPRLPGEKPDWHDPKQIALVGRALGALHPVLARYLHGTDDALFPLGALAQIHPLIPAPDELTTKQLKLQSTTETETQLKWWRAELATVRSFIDGPYQRVPRQLIHSDFSHSNTLYMKDETGDVGGWISAVLDFEFASPDARAMDLASGLYFCMRIWENPEPLINAEAFCRGYAQQQQLTAAEIAAIPWLMRLRNVASAIWWLGRQLTAGTPVDMTERIRDLQHFVDWLESPTGDRFTQTLQLLVRPSENGRDML